MKRPLVLLPALFAFLALTLRAADPVPAAVPVPAGPPASTVASDRNYAAKGAYQVYFSDYLALKKGHPADLIFIGDSITEGWRWGVGNAVWKKYFENRALDFGLGSDKTQHVLWRLQNIDLKEWSPKVAIIMIGTNNNTDTPEDIAAGVKAVIVATQAKFSGIRVVLVSILPNARGQEKMAAANTFIAPLADGENVVYLDLAAKFTPVGDNWLGLGSDKLHLTAAGYEMWAAALEPVLAKWLPKP